MSDPVPLIPAQRREVLMRHLRRANVLSIRQLTELLDVSHMTVRRDIATLEREGRVHSTPGGVRLSSPLHEELAYPDKLGSDQAEKAAIAARAGTYLRDGMTLYLDAGTTTAALLPAIVALKRMTVITNDLAIASSLIDTDNVETLIVGGRIDPRNRSTVGEIATRVLSELYSDIAFMSTSSWDIQRGLTTPSEAKIGPKQAALASTRQAVLLATSSKFGRVGMYAVAPLSSFHRIISDTGLSASAARGVQDQDVEIELVAPAKAEADRATDESATA